MSKRLFLAVLFLPLLFLSCAKRQIVAPVNQEVPVVAADTDASAERAYEAEIRFKDWESTPELQKVYFEYDKYELNASAREILKKNAEYMRSAEGLTFIVEGHCDERGTVEYNLGLGQRRAMVIRDYYGVLGIPLSNIGTISYGKEKPEAAGENESAWSKNRRAETKARRAAK